MKCIVSCQFIGFILIKTLFKWYFFNALDYFQDFRSSVEMICELLTDDLEGGTNSIPVWMFTVCYQFLAELDGEYIQNLVIDEK